MVKISFNKFHNKWEVYYHRKGKNHIGYESSWAIADKIRSATQKVLDQQ